jgi:hypothetical protein
MGCNAMEGGWSRCEIVRRDASRSEGQGGIQWSELDTPRSWRSQEGHGGDLKKGMVDSEAFGTPATLSVPFSS